MACGESCALPVAAESKSHVSHSTVEKQRRDRINSLIDEVWATDPCSAALLTPAA